MHKQIANLSCYNFSVHCIESCVGVKGLAASGSARYAAQRASSEERG